jgi:PEP-CTERM motif
MTCQFKKIIVILCLVQPISTHAYATFQLINRVPGLVDAPVFDSNGNPLSGAGYLAQLYVGIDQSSLQPLSAVTTFDTGNYAGYVKAVYINYSLWQPGTYSYQIRVWDASLGASFAIAAARGLGGVGESNITLQTAGGSGGVPSLPGAPWDLHSFSLSPLTVPEPSTYALFGVGVAALLWFHRRKP